jgi:hypothetical protein
MKHFPLNFLAAILVGHAVLSCQPDAPPGVAAHSDIPSVDVAKEKPSIADVDPATISPVNDGYVIDLDGDGVPDFVKLEGGVVSWTKGPADQHHPVAVLTIQGDLLAYTITVLPGDKLPSILFWDHNRKGYFRRCLGTRDGIPYFGQLEQQ